MARRKKSSEPSRMANVTIPVVFQLPQPKCEVALTLRVGQSIASLHAGNRLRGMLRSAFSGVDMTEVKFTTPSGEGLPDLTAAEYLEQHHTIYACGSDRFIQQLQQQIEALRLGQGVLQQQMEGQRQQLQQQMEGQRQQLQQQIDELRLDRSQLVDDQQKYRKILRRDIAVRARDLLSQEGLQPPDTNFYRFSTQLTPAFLEERSLTEDTIIFLNGNTIPDGDEVAHRLPLSELEHGLEGLTGRDLRNMTLLYNFVSQRALQQ